MRCPETPPGGGRLRPPAEVKPISAGVRRTGQFQADQIVGVLLRIEVKALFQFRDALARMRRLEVLIGAAIMQLLDVLCGKQLVFVFREVAKELGQVFRALERLGRQNFGQKRLFLIVRYVAGVQHTR